MASITDTTDARPMTAGALGKVAGVHNGGVRFIPAGTNYELHLVAPGYNGPIGTPVRALIRVKARKIWTVPSGGNFIAPIVGTPRIIQGRVKSLDQRTLVVRAGADIIVELPDDDIVYDMANGPILLGRMVNVTALPGASFELLM